MSAAPSPVLGCPRDGMGQPPFDELLDGARRALESRREEILTQAARVRALLDEYLAAVDRDLAASFAARNGLAKPVPPVTPAAIRALQKAVKALPEAPGAP